MYWLQNASRRLAPVRGLWKGSGEPSTARFGPAFMLSKLQEGGRVIGSGPRQG